MRNRVEEIKAKGFDLTYNEREINPFAETSNYVPTEFGKIRLGIQSLDDAIIDLGTFKKINPRLSNKENILRAIENYDLKTMREVSDFFYKTSGIYSRMLRYMSFMYRYDWFVTPYINEDYENTKVILENFHKVLNTLDRFQVKKTLGEIALKVLRDGAYYGYKVECGEDIVLQELPINYCRSRFSVGHTPVVEFNMKYFDTQFSDVSQRMRIIKMFPKEFAKGYALYRSGKLVPHFNGDQDGWYILDSEKTVKFNANGEDMPMFISVIPLIIELDEAQELDKKKTLQRLLKIVIQKMPLDKNGDLIFDVEEAQQLHNNAVQMLKRAIGVDVLTTFADVEVKSLAEGTAAANQTDDLERVERQVYNEWGGSQMLFNTSGNLALEKSIENDASTMYNLILQFEVFLNSLLDKYNKKPKKVSYRVQILTTTIYNFKEMAKLYKEQTQLGYSKMLPQIALGQSQSTVLANAYFENDILDLVNVFIPPLMSSTMNGEFLTNKGKSLTEDGIGDHGGEREGAGRKELPDDQKSEKTIANRESMS